MAKGKYVGIAIGIIVAIIVIGVVAYLTTLHKPSPKKTSTSTQTVSSVTIRIGGATAPMYQINY